MNPSTRRGLQAVWVLAIWVMAGLGLTTAQAQTSGLTYPIVDTNQKTFYDSAGSAISEPSPGDPYYGQDAQFSGLQPSYTISQDGLTVHDTNTGLTWMKKADLNGDGKIDVNDKKTADEALRYPATLNASHYGGYDDWRLPSIKELYSLMDYTGHNAQTAAESKPYINTSYFDFAYGDENAGERYIDSQWATTTRYVSTTMNGDETMFGVNFADGRIKGYPVYDPMGWGLDKLFYVRCVRGNPNYGKNDFVDNGDGTITDRATGLMWQQDDSGTGKNWQQALAYVAELNASKYLGYSDWRLPNVKELHSILDYTRSPDTTHSAAIDPLFHATPITDEGGNTNYAFYWSGTTHLDGPTAAHACYVCFGEALGWMEQPPGSGHYVLLDVHGAGAQRSDPKSGDPADYPYGHGPQGDVIRIYNYVRAVRDAGPSHTTAVAYCWNRY